MIEKTHGTLKKLAQRRSRTFGRALSAALLATTGFAADAATVVLAPISNTAAQGGQVSFELIANLGGIALGGAVDLGWDASIINFDSFAFDAGMAPPRRDSAFDVVDLQSPSLVSIGFANFSGINVSADTVIGVVTFDVVGALGSSAIDLSDSTKWGAFFSLSGDPISVSYTGADAFVAAPVPLPGTALFMLSGLAGLCYRRHSAARAA